MVSWSVLAEVALERACRSSMARACLRASPFVYLSPCKPQSCDLQVAFDIRESEDMHIKAMLTHSKSPIAPPVLVGDANTERIRGVNIPPVGDASTERIQRTGPWDQRGGGRPQDCGQRGESCPPSILVQLLSQLP